MHVLWILSWRHHRSIIFEDAAGHAAKVNGERHRGMLHQFFVPEMDGIDLGDMCHQ